MSLPLPSVGRRLLRPLGLAAVMFFTVSGGPYGLEPLLHHVGGNVALILIFLIPLVWSFPSILMVLELNGMMPIDGGYYQWVKTALGLRWGFLEGWWSWIFALADLAIYPVLFTQYLAFFFPELEPYSISICLAIVWICAGLNLLGIVPVGKTSTVLGIAVLVPFLVLFTQALINRGGVPGIMTNLSSLPKGPSAFAMGMFTVMWNYLGWDNGSPFAGEVKEPVRSYVKAFSITFLLIVTTYAMALLTASISGMDAQKLEQDGFPALGTQVGGHWLGALLSLGGMASALGLFLSNLLSISRVPAAMAHDDLLPREISRTHSRFGVPHIAILVCAIVVSGMVFWTFGDLIIIDVTLYSAALFLEFISLIALRIRIPEASRPIKIPLNVPGLVGMTSIPFLCLCAALWGLFSQLEFHLGAMLFAVGAIVSGPVVWAMTVWRKPHVKTAASDQLYAARRDG